MKRILKVQRYLWLALATGLTGCASPHVVEQFQVGDRKLSCPQLEERMQEADTFKAAAREEGGITGKNAAALALFWPALISTALNVNEAVDAAEKRKKHLYGIYVEKSCEGYVGNPNPTSETEQTKVTESTVSDPRMAELNQLREQEVISEEEYVAIKKKLLGL